MRYISQNHWSIEGNKVSNENVYCLSFAQHHGWFPASKVEKIPGKFLTKMNENRNDIKQINKQNCLSCVDGRDFKM